MATETLRIDVTVNNKTAIAGLKQTEAELGKVAAASLKTGAAVNRGSNQAANALTNLGRVAQDAPFGFIGIQNNLNPLLESFERLKVETGSTSGALKSLAGSLIGPAGLGFALSVASSLLLVFGDRLFKTNKETEKATKYNESYTNSLAQERTQLDSLFQAATNANAPLESRIAAVKEIRSEYGNYLKNFTDEEILAGKAATAYNQLAAAIVNAARARAAQDAIIELQKKAITNEIELAKIAAKAQEDASKARGIAASGTQGGFSRAVSAEQQRIGIFAEASVRAKELANEIAVINKEITQYAAIAASNQIKPFKEETIKNVNTQTEAVKKLTAAQLAQLALEQKIAAARAAFQSIQGGQPVGASGQTDTSFNAVGPSQGMVDRTIAVQEATKRQLDYANAIRLTAQNEEIAAAGASMATSAFTSLGQALLMGQDFGEALSNTFKRIIIDLTQMVVKALLFKAIMASLTGGTSEVAGAATGGGGFLGNLFKGLLGFADGGIASGPKSGYPVMLHGTEAVLNPKQFKNLTSNMMNMGAMQSQGGGMNLSGEFVVRGNDLVYVLNKQGFSNNLLGR